MTKEHMNKIRVRDDTLKDWGYDIASFAIGRSRDDNIPILTIPPPGSVIESTAGYPLTYFIDFALMFNHPKWMRENLGKAWGQHMYDIEGEYPIQFGSIVTPLWRDQMPAWAAWSFLQRKNKDFEEFYKEFPLFVTDSEGLISNPMAFITEDSRKEFQSQIKGKDVKVICPKFISPQVSALCMTMDEPPVVGFIRPETKSHGTNRIIEAAIINEGDKIVYVKPVYDGVDFDKAFGFGTREGINAVEGEYLLPVGITDGEVLKKKVLIEEVIDLHVDIPVRKEIVYYTPGLRVYPKDFDKDKRIACIVDVTTTGGTLEKTVLSLRDYEVNPSMCVGMIGFERVWRETAGCKMRFFEDCQTYTCTLITERELFESAVKKWPELAQRIAIETVIRDQVGKIRGNPVALQQANLMFERYLENYPFESALKLEELRAIANEYWVKFETR